MNADKNTGGLCKIPLDVPGYSGTTDGDDVDINTAVKMVGANLIMISGCPAD